MPKHKEQIRQGISAKVPVESSKLSNVETGQNLDGPPIENTNCCKLECVCEVMTNGSELEIG